MDFLQTSTFAELSSPNFLPTRNPDVIKKMVQQKEEDNGKIGHNHHEICRENEAPPHILP